jgi:hypothetical protein
MGVDPHDAHVSSRSLHPGQDAEAGRAVPEDHQRRQLMAAHRLGDLLSYKTPVRCQGSAVGSSSMTSMFTGTPTSKPGISSSEW